VKREYMTIDERLCRACGPLGTHLRS